MLSITTAFHASLHKYSVYCDTGHPALFTTLQLQYYLLISAKGMYPYFNRYCHPDASYRIIILNAVNSILESHSLMPCDYNA